MLLDNDKSLKENVNSATLNTIISQADRRRPPEIEANHTIVERSADRTLVKLDLTEGASEGARGG